MHACSNGKSYTTNLPIYQLRKAYDIAPTVDLHQTTIPK